MHSASRRGIQRLRSPKNRPRCVRGGGEGGGIYLRLLRACVVSSSNALLSWLAAARAAARTNFVAFAGPAALWIRSRSASLRRNAKTTSGSFGAFSFLGLASFAVLGFVAFAGFLLLFSVLGSMCLSSLLVVRSVLESGSEPGAIPFGVLLNDDPSLLAVRQLDSEDRELAIPLEGEHG